MTPPDAGGELARHARAHDRRVSRDAQLEELRFDERGLLPVVVQDAERGVVLMLAWANREALERSLESGEMTFWSRSRARLWKKGETSGNVLEVVSLHADCDGDALLARVRSAGPACHTGDPTCFGDAPLAADPITELWRVLESRASLRPEGSYTARLLADGNLRVKKLGEETAELVAALAADDGERARAEAADLLYHVFVALLAAGVSFDALLEELSARRR
jgi:phosphoribosyl-ATP pyrophosphohydrolase/phosphoribosyl-AMP cyclohydrolase